MMTLWVQTTTSTELPPFAEVFRQLYVNFIEAIPGIMTGAGVFLIFLIIAAIGRRVIAKLAPRANADTGVVLLLSRVFYYGVLTLGILTALPLTGLNINALVAGLGLTGFAIGFALKDVLSNLLSGIMLLIYRPFHIGDHIKMGEHEGVIVTIRMRDTVLRATDGRSVIIPNTKLITEVVVNNSTAQLARETIGVEVSDTDIGAARNILLRAITDCKTHVNRAESGVNITQAVDGITVLETGFWYDPRTATPKQAREEIHATLRRALMNGGIQVKILDKPASAVPQLVHKATDEEAESTTVSESTTASPPI